MKSIHYGIVVCGLIVGSSQVVAESLPQAALYCHIIAGIAAQVGAALGVLSKSALENAQ